MAGQTFRVGFQRRDAAESHGFARSESHALVRHDTNFTAKMNVCDIDSKVFIERRKQPRRREWLFRGILVWL
jgi:hypothetical protein